MIDSTILVEEATTIIKELMFYKENRLTNCHDRNLDPDETGVVELSEVTDKPT